MRIVNNTPEGETTGHIHAWRRKKRGRYDCRCGSTLTLVVKRR